MNTTYNLFTAIKKLALLPVLFVSISSAQGVFITEIADPNNLEDANAPRFVELYNNTTDAIDLTGWALRRWTNANEDPQSDKVLEGSIPAGGFFIITNNATKFQDTFGFAANQDIGTGGPADGNGDDDLALVNATGEVVDLYGEGGGTDNSGTVWEFEDGRAERKGSVAAGNASGDAAEWNIDNDSGGGAGPQNAPEDFDPGSWVGLESGLVGDWKLAPIAGAFYVSNADGSQIYWSNSQSDVTTRACMFDDKFKFQSDGVFKNELGDQTWLESWQGVEEGCGTPIAPHDGSNPATWSYDETGETITIAGVGAYLGLAKSYNGGELGPGYLPEDVPASVTYSVASNDGQQLKLTLDVGGNVWTFTFVRAEVEIPHINITFNVDMSNVSADLSADGVYVGGGTFFGGANDNPMTNAGNGIYTATISVPVNNSSNYTYLNGNCPGWDCKEQIAGQDCADAGNYNDRYVEWGEDDITINECFGLCGDGVCSVLTPPEMVNVTFNLDMSSVTTVSDQGVSVAGGGLFGDPGDNMLLDADADGIYSGTFELPANGSGNYTFTNGTSGWGDKENLEGQDCADAGNYNDRYMQWGDEDFTVNACFQVCGDGTCADLIDGPAISGIVFSGAFGGGSALGNVYSVPAGAEPWAGFANEDVSVYPFNFPAGGGINFKASTAGADVLVNFKFETQPNPPSEDPTYSTGSLTISGEAMSDYFVSIPALGSTSFSSFLLYVETRDVAVTINELEVFENDPPSPFAKQWKLDPVAGALVVSSEENGAGSVWWSNNEGDVDARSCLFDDMFVMHADGSFDNDFGSETWVEGWQGNFQTDADGNLVLNDEGNPIPQESCSAPVAPHDNSNDASWSYNETDMTITLNGVGAFLGLPKAINGAELQNQDDVVPASRTYKVLSIDGDHMVVSINVGGSFWRFKFIRDGYVNPSIDVTFAVDMSNEIVSESGVWLAGGGFGNTGLQLLDDDQDGVYEVTTQLNRGSTVFYKFRNRASTGGDDWGGFEHMVGNQTGCLAGQYSDRFIDVPVEGEDVIIPTVCYRACVPCEEFETIDITFNLDMSGHEGDVSDQLSVAGGVFFQNPGNNVFSDNDNDGIYTAIVNVESNFHSNFTYTNGNSYDFKENIAGQFCADRNNYDDRILHWGNDDIEVNSCFSKCGDGKCDDIAPSGDSDSATVVFSVSLIGYDWGLDENGELNDPAAAVYATGSFEGWTGWGVEMTQSPDREPGIYAGSRKFHKNQVTPEEYIFTLGGWDVQSKADLGGICDFNPADEHANYGFFVGDDDVQELPTYVFGGGCDVYSAEPVILVSACLPYHGENGYGGDFFGVSADVADLFNAGDEIFIHQGEIEVMYTVTNVAIAPGETCLDADGNPNTFYVYVDGNFVQDFGGPLMTGARIHFDDNDGGNDPCTDGTTDCNNLQFVGIIPPNVIDQLSTGLNLSIMEIYDAILRDDLEMYLHGSWEETFPEVGDIHLADFRPEISSVEDSFFVFLAGYPEGFPTEPVYYQWNIKYWDSAISGSEDEPAANIYESEAYFNYFDSDQGWCLHVDGANRVWDPANYEVELGLIADGNEDFDVVNIWPFDFFGTCDVPFDDDDDQPDWAVFLGEFEGHEYYVANLGLSWDNARDTAFWYEGHLATITSEAENQFIQQSLIEEGASGQFWIGAYEDYYDSQSGDRSFAWITGESFDYENWYPGEPNSPGDETAVELNVGEGGKWNDFAPNNLLGSIFEFPADGPEPDMGIVFDGTFDGTIYDDHTYTFPTGAQDWAGFANQNTDIYPFEFPNGGVIDFVGSTAGPDAEINFRFEYQPYPNTEPSFSTGSVTISGAELMPYQVEIPPQGDNTFSSFLLYVQTRDVAVTLRHVHVHVHGSGPEVITFTKPDNADPFLAENQDRISENVWITRGNEGGALYNAALENSYTYDSSPLGTRWAYGPTASQNSLDDYSTLYDAVYSFSNGFAEVVGETFSLHVLETDMFYDVTFNSWAQGNGGGGGAGGGFSYTRTTVEGGLEPPGPESFSNYELTIQDFESYVSATESTLPSLDVDGGGIVIKAAFEASADNEGPYVGALGVYWDANFNGVLDDEDYNLASEFMDNDDDDMDDGPRSRDHDGEEDVNVVALFDNGPNDTDDDVGVFVGVLDDFDFMSIQGATFFFVEIDDDGAVTNSFNVMPYSNGDFRFMGDVYYDNGDAFDISGIFVAVQKLVTTTWDDGNSYSTDYDDVAFGVTVDGSYNVGASDLVVGDTVDIAVEVGMDQRIFPYFSAEDEGNDGIIDGSFNSYVTLVTSDVFDFTTDIRALVFNTLIQGYALDENGNPLEGEVLLFWEAYPPGSEDGEDYLSVYNFTDVQDDGYYRLWAMNGTTVDIVFVPFGPGNDIENTVMVLAEDYSDDLMANIFNYNIDSSAPQQTGFVEGHVHAEEIDENGDIYIVPLAGVEVQIYNNDDLYTVFTDENGNYMAEVNAPAYYFISAVNNIDGYTNYDNFAEVFVDPDSYVDGGHIVFYSLGTFYTVSGYIYDQNDQPVADAVIDFSGVNGTIGHDYDFTDITGFYSIVVPEGMYDIFVYGPEHYTHVVREFDVSEDMTMNFTINQIGVFDGAVQGVVTFTGYNAPNGPAYIDVWNDSFGVGVNANDDGSFSIDLIDGVYDISVHAPGYMSYYMEDAFEISGNTVTYNVELFEYGYAGAPQMIDLHDVANDQGRQMRAVWHAGMPGSWNYFTQFSIWRKVNNAPVDLWDYIETVPWHGMDPYAAVVPTLGDSSAHGIHTSTFMVTAHTEDVSFWVDSEPMSGYSIDNLHPSTPMSLAFSTAPGSVSLTWSGSIDEDFSYFNIYRQDILSNEPAMVFTTVDSFYTDQALEDVGAYEYWITAVDMSGLESDASSIVSAVLSSEEELGMPTEFALKQNYPNPFNPSTQIHYALPSESMVVISIYDITGRKVRTLVNEVQSAGHRSVLWNATNEIGRPVSAGMYIYTIQAGDFIQNRKMVLMK